MLVPISWLKEFVHVSVSAAELAERLTLAGMEVAAVEEIGAWWDPETIVVGRIQAVHAHPNADRLVLVDVDYGGPQPERVVTGAPNVCEWLGKKRLPELKVPFARLGATLVDAYSEKRPWPKRKLELARIRGVESRGMACSELELGLSEEHEGVMFLSEDAPVGVPLRDYLGDHVLHFDLTPDMAHCLSVVGVAREVSALTGAPLRLPGMTCEEFDGAEASDYVEVEIADPSLCHRYIAAILEDVEIGPSPGWIRERLQKVGLRPISNVVDITNYVMLELGQPLHAFDYDVLKARAGRTGLARPKITVRTARPNETMQTLDGAERILDQAMLLITDSAGPIALAGVMGGADSEISDSTRNILLESATFEPINNRRTAQQLKLRTESSRRFTWGIPATLNVLAAARAANLMRQYAGGRIVPGHVDRYVTPQPVRVVYLTQSEVKRQLGRDMGLPAIKDALEKLGFAVEQQPAAGPPREPQDAAFGLHVEPGESLLRCTVPWYRLDVALPADLTEEVARVYGFDQMEPTLMCDALPEQRRDPILETEDRIRDVLVGIGLQETINYALTSPENHEKLGLHEGGASGSIAPYVTLANPLSVNRRVMRCSMLVSAVENLAHNARYAERLATFEIGRVYLPEARDDGLPEEDRRVSLLLSGSRFTRSIHGGDDKDTLDFFDLKGMVETLLARLGYGLEEIQFVSRPDRVPFGARCAEVRIDAQSVGILGELHPRIGAAFELPDRRICLAELRVEPLSRWAVQSHRMTPISNYPAVIEDLAFVVKDSLPAADLFRAIRAAGGPLLAEVQLFDVYRGGAVLTGCKSLAFRLVYQSLESTLSESQVTALRTKIVREVGTAVGATLRE